MSDKNNQVHSFKFFSPIDIIPKKIEISQEVSEQKYVEETFRILEKAVEQSIDGIAVADMKGIVRFCNEAWAKMHGYCVSELLGRHLSIFHNKEQMHKDVIPFNKKVKRNGNYQGEVGHIRKEGTTFPTWMTVTLLKDEKGKSIGIVGIARDITERNQILEDLYKSGQQLRLTIDSMADAIHLVDRELRLTFFNSAFKKWVEALGFNTDVIDKNLFEVFPFLSKDICDEYKKVFESGKILITEENIKIKDKDFVTETRKIPIFEDKKVIQIMTIVRNITEQKKTEEELRASEEKYRFLFENSPVFNAVITKEGIIKDINSLSTVNFGYSKDEIIGKNALGFIVPEDRKKTVAELEKSFSGERGSGIELNVRAKSGSVHTLWFCPGQVLLYEENKPASMLFTGIDITERKQSEKRQSSMTINLRACLEAADEFIGCAEIETIFRKAVEFARERFGLERCAIFVEELGYVHGIYGTDRYGRTTDERALCFEKNEAWKKRLRMLDHRDPSWFVVKEPQLEWNGKNTVVIGEGWIVITPLQSAHRPIGVFVNDAAISGAALDPMKQDTLAVFCSLLGNIIERKRAERKLEIVNKRLLQSSRRFKQLALRDSHTGLYNHRYLEDVIETEFNRAKRSAYSFAAIMLDIDYFKSINDVYDHQFGDLVLKQFSRRLKRLVRQYDIVVRFGGEEFIIISPGLDKDTALGLARRLLDGISLCNFGDENHNIKLKLSVAVTSYPEDNVKNGMELINLADKILNKVKEDGGDRVYSSLDIKKPEPISIEKTQDYDNVKFLQERLEKLTKRSNQSLVESISAFAKTIKLKDQYTGEHVENTVYLATEIARRIGMATKHIEDVRQAAKLHDLGKIGISDKILLKKSKLTRIEFEEIKKHTLIGADILRPIHFLHDIIPLVLHHHERWDGGGYPHGLKQDEIPIGARIVAIADVYQALVSDRPYRRAFSKPAAVKLIRQGSGTQFDPKVVDTFLSLV